MVLDDPSYAHLLNISVSQQDFIDAVLDLAPSLSPKMLEHYAALREKFST